MAELSYDQHGNLGPITQGVSPNDFDYVRQFATKRTNDAALADKLAVTYIVIAESRGITVQDFVKELKAAGSSREQDALIAAYLNAVQPRTAIVGISGLIDPPFYVAREIKA
jgi:hypothetical protein